MDSLEPKKLALIRIWQILKDWSDDRHPLTQEHIANLLGAGLRHYTGKKSDQPQYFPS